MKKPILVTSYVNSDLDGLSGAFAYAEYLRKTGVEAKCGLVGEFHLEACYVLDRFNIEYPKNLDNSDAYNEIVLIDSSHLRGLRGKIDRKKVIEIIDHHKSDDIDKFPKAKDVQVELIGAAATLVAERFMENDIEISREAAILLMGGIISNTLNFKAKQTHKRDYKAYEWLNRRANLPEDFWVDLFRVKSDLSGEKLTKTLIGDTSIWTIGEKNISISQLEIIESNSLLSGRIDEIIEIITTISQKRRADMTMLTIVALDEEKNYFISPDGDMQKILELALGVTFEDNLSIRKDMIMRKDIIPLLKEVLEKK